jgi:hypothetical protein
MKTTTVRGALVELHRLLESRTPHIEALAAIDRKVARLNADLAKAIHAPAPIAPAAALTKIPHAREIRLALIAGALSASHIAKAIDVSDETVRRSLQQMAAARLVEHNGVRRGKFSAWHLVGTVSNGSEA